MLKNYPRIKRLSLNILAVILLSAAIFMGFRLWPHPHLSESLLSHQGVSTVYFDRQGSLLRITSASDERYRLWTPLDSVPISFQHAVLLYEDRHFYRHFGFNPVSLIRGFIRSYVLNQRLQGGSTITMQLARMHWQLNTRTLQGKLAQVLRAVQLELSYSKHEILEAYLNYAPYGRNIESIGAASLIYFDKTPDALNLPEMLTLAVLPQSPSLRLKNKTGLVGDRLIQARNRLYERWVKRYPEDEKYRDFFQLPLKLRQPEQVPFIAPHFTDMLYIKQSKQNPIGKYANYSIPEEARKTYLKNQFQTTTLDSQLQGIIERQVQGFIQYHENRGIQNASVLLVDTRDMGVRALVGSADYFDKSIHGQVNGTLAKRSPGSTLKPFIYALALDQGILHPATILRDVPIQYGAYSPENYDLQFLGPISTTKALNYSRNIPAVSVAAQLKHPDLYEFLKKAGVQKLANRNHYGLALVLGGGEINPQELARLYAILANKGVDQPLRFIEQVQESIISDTPKKQTKLLSDAAAFITMDMLGQHLRPGDTLAQAPHKIPVYWKTGTSWGFRDAWTAGIFGPYVLVVWQGNFSGEGNNAFVGVDAAAPLFFNIIDSITAHYPNLNATSLVPPDTIKKVEVCLTSGQLPTQWCKQVGKTWFIPGVSPIKADSIFRPLAIDKETGEVACPPFEPERIKIEVFEYWPSDLALAFAQAGVPKRPPPKNDKCLGSSHYLFKTKPPSIISPQKNVRYTFKRSSAQKEDMRNLLLIADSDTSNTRLYWFVDGSYLGSTIGKQGFAWEPKQSGEYTLRVIDEAGQADTRNISVHFIN